MKNALLPLAVIAGSLVFSNCTCADPNGGWELTEDLGLPSDLVVLADEEMSEPADVTYPRDMWVPDEVVANVPLSHALNERTSLAVDENGTLFLGFHACDTRECEHPDLVIARRGRGQRDFTFETVKEQRGTFGIEVANPEEVVAAFLDPTDNTFKVARRLAPGEFEQRTLGVRRTGISDGLDITPDSQRMFVTFANERGDPVSLFVLAQGEWRGLQNLDIGDASAAYERGLGSDGQGNLYLVHRNGGPSSNEWGLARYSLTDGEWKERTYFETRPLPRPSSFVVKANRELCIAGDTNNLDLVVTCGDMTDLDRDRWNLDEDVALGAGGYSSMLEGSDGSLYVAYPTDGNTALRLATKTPDDVWTTQTVFEKNAYGVSTIIDHSDLLVISYYTCGSQNCSLEVISRPQ